MKPEEIERLMEKEMVPGSPDEVAEIEAIADEEANNLEEQLKDFIEPEPETSELEGVQVIINIPKLGQKPIFTFLEYTRPVAAREIKAILRRLFKAYRKFKNDQARESRNSIPEKVSEPESTNPKPSEEVLPCLTNLKF